MKLIKTWTTLKDFKGKELKDGVEDLTIGKVITNVLSGKVSNPTLGYTLAKKFATNNIVDLKAEEVVFIKHELEENQAHKDYGYTALVTGQAIEILEATDAPEVKKTK